MAPVTFALAPSWSDDERWVVAAHNFLRAFPADAPVRLWLPVDPARLGPDEALQRLGPVLAPFGDAPFPELALGDDPAEGMPPGALALGAGDALLGWSVRRLREASGLALPPVAPTSDKPLQRTLRARRAKAERDAVRLLRAHHVLGRARAAHPDVWGEPEPLVSVRIATYDRPQLLLERAVASALGQSYRNLEVVVVGDGAGPETAEALARVADPRLRYENLPARPAYARFPRAFWFTAGTHAVNRALALCRGEWIAPLDDDDTFTPDHVERLLAAAREARAEFAYGQMEVLREGAWVPLGSAPLAASQVCHGAVLYHRRLLALGYDEHAWLEDEPGDWNLWKRFKALDVQAAFVPRVVGRHYPETSGVQDPEERRRLFQRAATPEEVLADLEHTGAHDLLAME